jgi:hypothetical protein
MWQSLAKRILKNRIALIITFIAVTFFMGWKAQYIKLSYAGAKILPLSDSAFVAYNSFKKQFGEDGNMVVLGIQSDKILQKGTYNNWAKLSSDIKNIKGIKGVLSIGHLFELVKDTTQQKFALRSLPDGTIQSDAQMDSLKNKLANLIIYDGLLINRKTNATLMAISIDQKILNTAGRNPILKEIERLSQEFSKSEKIDIHISGLPYIRTATSKLVSNEFVLFLGLSILISAIILIAFYRSLYSVLFPMLIVMMGVVCSVGTIVLFGYEITLLTGLIPPIIVIIGVPNSILLLNKYRSEIRNGASKQQAWLITIEKISETTLIANLTAAIGFAVLCFTGSELLIQFGGVAAINIMLTWLLSLCLVPAVFSYLPTPKLKPANTKKSGLLTTILNKIDFWVAHKRKQIYGVTIIVSLIAFVGAVQVNVNGYVVDDLPQSSTILRDLKFFEKNFEGILPLEIKIDTKKKNGMLSLSTLKKIEHMEQMITAYPEFSKSISLNAGLKYATQVFYNGDTAFYRLPSDFEKNFILIYAANSGKGNGNMLSNFMDKDKQMGRISFQMADIGSKRFDRVMEELKPRIDSILSPKRYEVTLTGSSIIFSKGTDYMLRHLIESISIAIVLISFIRFLQFRSVKIMLISLLPNAIPLLITAGLMGYFGLPLKPSTILIFTIAFGLASDQTIYFLTRYQQETIKTNFSIPTIISHTIKDTGVSMVHIALVLFFGFGIFTASTFGGTVILGFLLSITLLVALIFNLTLLPALMLWLDKNKKRKKLSTAESAQNLKDLSDH